MKFSKEIKIVIEGEIYDKSIDPIEVFKSLKISWKHWWENNAKWIYGEPSTTLQAGKIEKITFEDKEIENFKEN